MEAKKKETEKEMLHGSRPNTPAKRPRLLAGSAHNTPKRRKGVSSVNAMIHFTQTSFLDHIYSI